MTTSTTRPGSGPDGTEPGKDHRRRALGEYGETLAARHLTDQGMVLLDRNWRCPDGEIDLVLRDGDDLVVCEVKTRTTEDFGSPLEGVSEDKARRLRRLAAHWLEAHPVHPRGIRLDLVGVVRPRRGPSRVEHVAGVG